MSLAEDINPRAVIGGNNPPIAEDLAHRFFDLLSEVDAVTDRAKSLPAKVSDDILLGRFGDVSKAASKLKSRIDTTRLAEGEPHRIAQSEINGFFNVFVERLKDVVKSVESRATDYQRAKAAEERRKLEDAARKAREEQDRQREIAEAAAAKNRPSAALKHEDRAEEAGAIAARAEQAARASAADLTRVRSGSGTVATMKGGWDFEILDITKIPLETLRPYLGTDVIGTAVRKYVQNNKGAGKLEGVRIFQNDRAIFR